MECSECWQGFAECECPASVREAQGVRVFEFVFNELPKRPGKAHWAVLAKQKKQWAEALGWLSKQKKCPPVRSKERRSVRVLIEAPGVRRDRDNLNAMLKVPLDALQRAGLLFDDSPDYLDQFVDDKSSGTTRTVVQVMVQSEGGAG